MPIVRIDIIEGKSEEYKVVLLDSVNQAMQNHIGLQQGDRRQIITEHRS